jgi:plasmid replication initiation protein
MTKRTSGQDQIDSISTNDLIGRIDRMRDQHRRIEAEARSGESHNEEVTRLRQEKVSTAPSTIRRPPKSDQQLDIFMPALYDVGTKDSRSIMDVAVFRLSKKEKRAGEIIRYDLPDGHVEVSSGPAGMASVWDYDLVLMAVSHLTEAMNRFRDGKGEKPGRVFRPHVGDVLRFCRRTDGGKQKDDLVATCIRLNTTHVAMQRTKKAKNGRTVTVSEGEALISRYKIITNENGKPEYIEIELAEWMFREIVEGKNPEVLTVHPDYFLIDPGIGRFVYRLARRAAGKTYAKWAFQTIYERSGSSGTLKKFSFTLRKLIEANDIPEYTLSEEKGQIGPILVMQYRSASIGNEEEEIIGS